MTADDWALSRHAGPTHSKGFLFWRDFMRWQRGLNAALRPHGLTQPQFAVLAMCGWLTRDGTPASQVQVGALADMDKMHISQLLGRLEQAGLITRAGGVGDGRIKVVELTAAGGAVLARTIPIVEAYDADFFNPARGVEHGGRLP